MTKQKVTIIGINPFERIGLAFSGGGFRAATFSLGALSYLDRLQLDGRPLTANISYTSSASGGTITIFCILHLSIRAGT